MLSEREIIKNAFLRLLSYNCKIVKALNKPVMLNVEVTNRCNLDCRMCPRENKMIRPIGNMPFGLFKKIVNETAPWLHTMALCWMGESLIHPELDKMINYAKTKGVHNVYLSTNLTLLNDAWSERLLDSGLDLIILSLDGVTKKTYEAVRCRADFETSVNNVKRFLKIKQERGLKKPVTHLRVILMNETEKEQTAFKKFWEGYPGLDLVSINKFCTWAGQVDASQSDEKNWYHKGKSSVHPCAELWSSLRVTWDGVVTPCQYDINAAFNLGNVKNDLLLSMWNNSKMQELRVKSIKRENEPLLCQNCVDRVGHGWLGCWRDLETSSYFNKAFNVFRAFREENKRI